MAFNQPPPFVMDHQYFAHTALPFRVFPNSSLDQSAPDALFRPTDSPSNLSIFVPPVEQRFASHPAIRFGGAYGGLGAMASASRFCGVGATFRGGLAGEYAIQPAAWY